MKKYNMKINGQNYEARIVEFNDAVAKITVNGIDFDVEFENDDSKTPQIIQVERTVPLPIVPEVKKTKSSESEVKAPIPGVVVTLKKNEGDKVEAGEILLTLEAMKMESEIVAPISGVVEKIFVKERSPVQEGDILMKLQSEIVDS